MQPWFVSVRTSRARGTVTGRGGPVATPMSLDFCFLSLTAGFTATSCCDKSSPCVGVVPRKVSSLCGPRAATGAMMITYFAVQ